MAPPPEKRPLRSHAVLEVPQRASCTKKNNPGGGKPIPSLLHSGHHLAHTEGHTGCQPRAQPCPRAPAPAPAGFVAPPRPPTAASPGPSGSGRGRACQQRGVYDSRRSRWILSCYKNGSFYSQFPGLGLVPAARPGWDPAMDGERRWGSKAQPAPQGQVERGAGSIAGGLEILDTTPKSCFRGKARHRLNTQPRCPGDCHLSREETRSLELQQGPASLLPADLRH